MGAFCTKYHLQNSSFQKAFNMFLGRLLTCSMMLIDIFILQYFASISFLMNLDGVRQCEMCLMDSHGISN